MAAIKPTTTGLAGTGAYAGGTGGKGLGPFNFITGGGGGGASQLVLSGGVTATLIGGGGGGGGAAYQDFFIGGSGGSVDATGVGGPGTAGTGPGTYTPEAGGASTTSAGDTGMNGADGQSTYIGSGAGGAGGIAGKAWYGGHESYRWLKRQRLRWRRCRFVVDHLHRRPLAGACLRRHGSRRRAGIPHLQLVAP